METKNKRKRITGNLDKELTPCEILLLWRRRLDWNQEDAAKYFGVSLFNYKLAEYGKAKSFNYPKLSHPMSLSPWEKCLIYRKRSGKTQKEIATKIGVGRYWLRLQEMGTVPCQKLLNFWENKK